MDRGSNPDCEGGMQAGRRQNASGGGGRIQNGSLCRITDEIQREKRRGKGSEVSKKDGGESGREDETDGCYRGRWMCERRRRMWGGARTTRSTEEYNQKDVNDYIEMSRPA